MQYDLMIKLQCLQTVLNISIRPKLLKSVKYTFMLNTKIVQKENFGTKSDGNRGMSEELKIEDVSSNGEGNIVTPTTTEINNDDAIATDEKVNVDGNADVPAANNTVSRKRRTKSANYDLTKGITPSMKLNELHPGLKFEYSSVGTPGNPVFECSVVLNDKTYTSSAPSKRDAKHSVSAQILSELNPSQSHLHYFTPPSYYNIVDFTEDEPLYLPHIPFNSPPPQKKQKIEQDEFLDSSITESSPASAKKQKPDASELNPVMVLHERSTEKLEWDVSPQRIPTTGKFLAKVTVAAKTYEGKGTNKKLAKCQAAAAALADQFGIIPSIPPTEVPIDDQGEEMADAGNLPDLIMDLIVKKFSELTKNQTTPEAKYKVMAGIVMTRINGPNVESGEVVSLATGTKCIGGEFISTKGTVLNDCHAEIISRRGLKKFLYQQLLLQISGLSTEPLFNRLTSGRYRLKEDVYFHLYISSSPCGDARIFSPHETKDNVDDHPNRQARAQLRTKIENGEGTIPIPDHAVVMRGVQPFDSIIGGERLRTMSCSDKIARWNVLGIQGSLLSMVIEPVYLSSVVLGSLYHGQHLKRALYGRIVESLSKMDETESTIPAPFKINKPLLAVVSNPECRKPSKAPNLCVHWTKGDEVITVVDMMKGKTLKGESSNLSKREMFQHFTHLHEALAVEDKIMPTSYSGAKSKATAYKEVKEQLYKSLEKSGLGIWMTKPEECEGFH